MKTLITENFILNYQEELEVFSHDLISISNQRMPLIKSIFGSIPAKKIKASFFVDRKLFVDYIKKVSNGAEPPQWASGCFYNGEIQILVNANNERDIDFKKHTLTHEFVHLCFNHFIYDKYNINRIRWFDESYANFIDGSNEDLPIFKLKNIANSLKSIKDFDVNILNDINKVKTSNYNGYDMFLLIGKYIFCNNLEKQYIETLKSDPEQIINIGKSILNFAIRYIETLN